MTDKLKEVKGLPFINPIEKYILNIDSTFDDFIIKEIGLLQNILDVKKEAKKEYTSTDWIANDTNNWLKKDGTYKEIYEKVIKKMKQ